MSIEKQKTYSAFTEPMNEERLSKSKFLIEALAKQQKPLLRREPLEASPPKALKDNYKDHAVN